MSGTVHNGVVYDTMIASLFSGCRVGLSADCDPKGVFSVFSQTDLQALAAAKLLKLHEAVVQRGLFILELINASPARPVWCVHQV